jgi:ABC-2 type transport system ATP-binding protein
MEEHMETAISVQHVYKSFKGDAVLTDVTHDFEAGKIHGVVGNNGSGKTVLFKCVCGFMFPSKGRIFVHGEEVGRKRDFPDDLGIIIESPGFLMQYSGMKNLEILASLKRKIGAREIAGTIRRVGLDPSVKKPVGKYSLGMRQRLGIAQAIMESPRLLILDEPMNGLDKRGVADVRQLLKELRSEGRTIILASHNAADIDELCDTVCEMDAGVLAVVRSEKGEGQ